MSLAYINLKHKESLPKMWLCRPDRNRVVVDKLTDIKNANLYFKLGNLHQLTFEAPLYVERNHQMVKNPFIDRFKGYYYVKVEYNGLIEYFVYVNGNSSYSDDGHSLSYTLYSLGYLLGKKLIRSYNETSKTLSYHAREFLLEAPDWSIGYVDAKFDLKYRSMEIPELSIGESLVELALKFGAIIIWDTINQRIEFHDPDNIGVNKGLLFKEDNFLENYSIEDNYDSIVTRLYVYGNEGLEFRRLSPTGANYIESLDYFIYPFEQDSSGNVINSSYHMDDDVCIAIRRYEALVKSKEAQFGNLSRERSARVNDSIQLNQQLTVLITERNVIENERWTLNKTLDEMLGENDLYQIEYGYDRYTQGQINQVIANRDDAVNRLNAKNAQIASQNAMIDSIKNTITSLDNQITALRNQLKVENNYTTEQLKQINKFIHHGSYTNDAIIDEQDLLDAGLEEFKKVNQPSISFQLSVVNFLEDVQFEKLKDRISLGDTVRLRSKALNRYLEAKIIEIAYNFDNDSFTLTIANEKDISDEWTTMLEKVYSSANTSTTVNIQKYQWDKAQETASIVDEILNSEYDSAKNAITAGYMDLTTLDRFGLKSYEYNNPNSFLFINNGILGITANNLNTIEVAISKRGVHAERIVGKIVLSKKLVVEDELGVIEMYSGLQTIYDNMGRPRVYLGRYPSPDNANVYKYGLRIVDGAFDIRTSDQPNRGVQIDVNGIRTFNNNGVTTFDVNASTGLVSLIGSINIKSSPNTNQGTVIDGNGIRIYNASGILMFSADNFGNLFYRGELRNAYGTVTNLGGTLQDMGGNFIGSINSDGQFRGLVTGTLSAQTVNAININASQITAGTISADRINTQSLTSATIDVDQLRANNAQITNLSAISSDLGNITGGNIDISESISIGDGIFMKGGRTGIYFPSYSQIFDSGGSLTIESFNDMSIVSQIGISFIGRVDFSQAIVTGL